MKKKLIFIHSLFRTGSTYIWNKFRQNPEYHCYYEPFHQIFLKVNSENVHKTLTQDYEKVKHPILSEHYLKEYESLLNNHQGVPLFKKEFSFDQFCKNDKNIELKKYIQNLLNSVGDKTPVLQFNRTALRSKWFKKNYKDSVNIYLVRNPRDQFQSYFELMNRVDTDVFFTMDLLIAGKNSKNKYFKELNKIIELFYYNSDNIDEELFFYSTILNVYSDKEKYFIFYYIWLSSLVENISNADFILNIDKLSTDDLYKNKIQNILENYNIKGVEFSEAKVQEYKDYNILNNNLEDIESLTQNLIFKKFDKKNFDYLFKEIEELNIPGLNKNKILESKRSNFFYFNLIEKKKEKIDLVLKLLNEKIILFDSYSKTFELNENEKDREIKSLMTKYDNLLNVEKKREYELKNLKNESIKFYNKLKSEKEKSITNIGFLNRELFDKKIEIQELKELNLKNKKEYENEIIKLNAKLDIEIQGKENLEVKLKEQQKNFEMKLKEQKEYFNQRFKEQKIFAKNLENQLDNNNRIMRSNKNAIFNSYTYRTGRFILSPIRFVKNFKKNTENKLAFIDHSFHKKSQATEFLIRILKQKYDVEVFWDDSWNNGPKINIYELINGDFKRVVFFQSYNYSKKELKKLGFEKIILIPMYDGSAHFDFNFWRKYKKTKIINFSKNLHEKLLKFGLNSTYFQFFPKSEMVNKKLNNHSKELVGFFWQRIDAIDWDTIKKLIGKNKFSKIYINCEIDPHVNGFKKPLDKDIKEYNIEIIQWQKSRDNYLKILQRCDVFFAPRLYEGIGMAFLEAMSMGICVVAPNNPTMNEYIKNGINGILYNPRDIKPLDFSETQRLGKKGRETIDLGFKKWNGNKKELIDFINKKNIYKKKIYFNNLFKSKIKSIFKYINK